MLDVDYTPANKAETEAQASTPYELGLGFAVHLKKTSFVGKRALAEEKARGSALALVGVEIDHVAFRSRRTPRSASRRRARSRRGATSCRCSSGASRSATAT